MPTLSAKNSLRQAEPYDRSLLSRFLNSSAYTHRHLDWRDALDWLGSQPFWILEKFGEPEAVIACPPDPADTAWIRLFAVSPLTSPAWCWSILFERVLTQVTSLKPVPQLVSLALNDWYEDLLTLNGFTHHQDIVVLSYETQPPPPLEEREGLILRAMQPDDLEAVTRVDNLAFEPIWRLSFTDINRAFDRSSYKTVMELDGELVGYQMSALNGFSAHLSRLAVLPDLQRQRIGYRLVQNALDHYINGHRSWGVTLNTQDNNASSLSLYRKIGFRLTGEHFPVFVYSN